MKDKYCNDCGQNMNIPKWETIVHLLDKCPDCCKTDRKSIYKGSQIKLLA